MALTEKRANWQVLNEKLPQTHENEKRIIISVLWANTYRKNCCINQSINQLRLFVLKSK